MCFTPYHGYVAVPTLVQKTSERLTSRRINTLIYRRTEYMHLNRRELAQLLWLRRSRVLRVTVGASLPRLRDTERVLFDGAHHPAS